jgi:hypothetical protein
VLARYGISIHFAQQKALPDREGVSLVLLTQPARDQDVRDALGKIHTAAFVAGRTQMLRIHR